MEDLLSQVQESILTEHRTEVRRLEEQVDDLLQQLEESQSIQQFRDQQLTGADGAGADDAHVDGGAPSDRRRPQQGCATACRDGGSADQFTVYSQG